MYTREIKLSGHIIDSLMLPKTLDRIMDKGGDFKILDFQVGKRKKDASHATIRVAADTESLLGEILDDLSEIGALVVEIKEVQLLKIREGQNSSTRFLFNNTSPNLHKV